MVDWKLLKCGWIILTLRLAVAGGIPWTSAGVATAWEVEPHPLDNLRTVRSLLLSPGASGPAFEAAVTVVYSDERAYPGQPYRSVFVVADGTGVYVTMREGRPLPPAGTKGWLKGIVQDGGFAPLIADAEYEPWEKVPWPVAVPLLRDDLLGGRHDAEWGVLEGVLRGQTDDGSGTELDMVSQGVRISIAMAGPMRAPGFYHKLIGTRIKVTGAVSTRLNKAGQMFQVELQCPDDLLIEPLPTPWDPSAPMELSPEQLLQYQVNPEPGAPVRVRGRITGNWDGYMVFLEKNGKALRMNCWEQTWIPPGALVEATGYPVFLGSQAGLEDAVVQRIGWGGVPSPTPTEVAAFLDGAHEAALVSLEGELLETSSAGMRQLWLFKGEDGIFTTEMAHPVSPAPPRGSKFRVSGIAVSVANMEWKKGSGYRPRDVRLLVGGGEAVELLERPAWWTLQRVRMLAAGTALILGLAFLWIRLLRGQARRQTATIRQQVEQGAVLQERLRIARDLHDTVAQGLSGTLYQLETVKSCLGQSRQKSAMECLVVAEGMARASLEEARAVLTNLRSVRLESAGLSAAFQMETETLLDGRPQKFTLNEQGIPWPMGSEALREIQRLGLELIRNAVQHGEADQILLSLIWNPQLLVLEVRDDGKGFTLVADAQGRAVFPPGHYGLAGVDERAALLEGMLEIHTAPGSGTRVRLEIARPLRSLRTRFESTDELRVPAAPPYEE